MIDPNTALYCLEVGQGSCTVIIEPDPERRNANQATVIDVGEYGTLLGNWLKSVGVKRINAILLTHNDRDHIGGLAQLVQIYKGRINKLFFVIDRRKKPSFWIPAQMWEQDGWINEIETLSAPLSSRRSTGRMIIGPDDECSFRLYCSYPPTMWSYSFFGWLPSKLTFFTGGRNYMSAVLRVTPRDANTPTHALIGGDLDYKGWEYLARINRDLRCDLFVVPHHGGPQRQSASFASRHLAEITRSKYALISVGTDNGYKLPHADLIRQLRTVGTTVICTQITQECLTRTTIPASVPKEEILPRLPDLPRVCPSGTACGGSIIVTFPAEGCSLHRATDHQKAVDDLLAEGNSPMCRR